MKFTKVDWYFIFISVAIIGVFFYGMTQWIFFKDNYTNNFEKNLYYITVSSVMYMLSFTVLLLSRTFLYKCLSSLLVALFGCNLYIELFLDPTNWSLWDGGMIIAISLKLLLVNILIEKIKNTKDVE